MRGSVVTKSSRRAVSAVALVGVLIVVLASCTDDPSPSSLFTLTSSGGSFVEVDPATENGFHLTLTGVSATTVQFTDRPERQATTISTADLVANWPATFGSDPPNAAIVLEETAGSDRDTVVVTLTNPVYDQGAATVEFDTVLVRDIPDSDGLAFARADADARLPQSFGPASVFIDNAEAPSSSGSAPGTSSVATSDTTSPDPDPTVGTAPPPTPAALRCAPRDGVSGPAVLYATFSGETEKHGSNPVNNVLGFDADGRPIEANASGGILTGTTSLQDELRGAGVLSHKDEVPFELRGMAFGPDGTFHVTSSHKNASMILRFGPAAADGTRSLLPDQPWVIGPNWKTPNMPSNVVGMQHPYGLAFNGSTLYLTTQDSNLGMWLDATKTGPSVTLPRAAWLSGQTSTVPFLLGTFAPAAAYGDQPAGVSLPDVVASENGGLTGARGVAHASNGDWSMIVIADSADGSVKGYDAVTGAPYGKIWDYRTKNPGAETPEPVGLAVAGTTLFVGDEANSSVVAIDLSGFQPSTAPISHTETGSTATTVVAASEVGPGGTVTIDRTSGLVFDRATNQLYVGSRKGMAINRYTLQGGTVSGACVFAANLTDTPEQLVAVPAAG